MNGPRNVSRRPRTTLSARSYPPCARSYAPSPGVRALSLLLSGLLVLTAAVAGYGLLLKGSAFAGTLTWETVRAMAAGAKGADPDGFRGEFLQLVEKAAGFSAPAAAPASQSPQPPLR